MIHGDGNTRQCMATAVVAYKQSFGFDAPPYTYADFEESDVIVLVGSNLCIAHPIMWERVLPQSASSPKSSSSIPRRTETAMAATLIWPLKPKSDLTLLYGARAILCREGWIDREFHRRPYHRLRSSSRSLSRRSRPNASRRERASRVETIEQLARTIHAGRASFVLVDDGGQPEP